jgi:outer membrane protein insertion porin family
MQWSILIFAISLYFLGVGSDATAAIKNDAFLDRPLSVDAEISAINTIVGRTVSRVNIDDAIGLSPDLLKQFRGIQGQPYDPARIYSLIKWFNESFRDARVYLVAQKNNSGVEINVRFFSKRKITKISFVGIQSFDEDTLSPIVVLKDGDDIDEGNLESAVSRVLDFYRNAGFLQSSVTYEVRADDSVVFQVVEGSVAKIKSVSIADIQGIGDPREKTILMASALSAFGIKVGDRLDRKEIKLGISRLKEWLRSRDFLIAKEPIVNSVIFDNGTAANLEISISYGPRIRFGFRKNHRFSYRELTAAVAEVQEIGIGSDYLETVKAKIIEMYNKVGLVNVRVDTIVREDPARGYRYISFDFDEGDRVRIERLGFEGIYSLDKEKSLALFLSFSPRIVQRSFFQDAGIRSAGELLADHLRSSGFLSARLDVVKYKFNEKRDKVEVDLYFTEGVQTFVNDIRISGLKNLTPEEVQKILALEKGKPFNVFAFEKGIANLKEKYRNLGYLTMDITNESNGKIVAYGEDQSVVDVTLDIEEGLLIRVGEIIVRGNKQTHSRVVTRELPFVKGDVLSRQLQIEAEENLRKLNLFSSVIIRPVERPGSADVRDIIILVEEGIPGLIEAGPGFRNDLGLRFFVGGSYQNLGGWHRGINARAVVNRRLENFRFMEYRVSVGFREPYFAGWRVTLFTNVEVLRRIFSSFDATSNKVTTEFRRELTKRITGLLQYSFERVKTFNAKLARDNELRLIGAITPGVIYDSRNDIFNPSSGLLSVNRFELASSAFGSQKDVGYYRATSNNTAYVDLTNDFVWGFALNFGFERSNLVGKEIPKIKLFRLGGTSTLRGYQEESLEVDSTTAINGTLSLVNYRSELRFPIEGDFGGALFWDAGNLFVDKVLPFQLRHSAGVGLRYKTPVGPVSLDFARKLGRIGSRNDKVNTDDLDVQRVHFSIGAF